MKRAALLLLALAVPAAAQDAKPLREAQQAPLGPTPLDRAKESVETLARFVPPTSKLVPTTKGKVRLAIVLVELADCPRPKYERQAWQDMLFTKGFAKDADGRAVHGSVRDYYHDQSAGKLDVTGTVFDWVTIPAKRKDIESQGWYAPLAKRSVLNAALDRLLAREGKNALDAYDGLGFLVAGDSSAKWGTVLWPHSSMVFHGGKVWRYYLSDAASGEFPTIGVHAHEIGHVLGLPDEYGVQGGGSGIYCLMAVGNAGGSHHFLQHDAPVTSPREALEKEVQKQVGELRGNIEKFLKPLSPRASEASREGDDQDPVPPGSELFCLA
ncbi:MAG: immune inhibitor A domain-containing protein, partial [Planctomycetota bacterium]